jgi:prophage regulatory protein
MREHEVAAATGLSRTTRYEMAKRGDFPERVIITGRLSGNFESEIRAWMESRQRAHLKHAA